MIRKERRGLMKVLAAAGLAGAVIAGTALAASAMIPKPGTIRIADGYTFKNLTGYQSPGAGTNCNAYAPDTAFSFQVDVTNGFGARDQKFNVQVFKMADLNPGTCYTEAQLENMVLTGHNATETAVSGTDEAGNTASYHFEYGTTRTVTGVPSGRFVASSSKTMPLWILPWSVIKVLRIAPGRGPCRKR